MTVVWPREEGKLPEVGEIVFLYKTVHSDWTASEKWTHHYFMARRTRAHKLRDHLSYDKVTSRGAHVALGAAVVVERHDDARNRSMLLEGYTDRSSQFGERRDFHTVCSVWNIGSGFVTVKRLDDDDPQVIAAFKAANLEHMFIREELEENDAEGCFRPISRSSGGRW